MVPASVTYEWDSSVNNCFRSHYALLRSAHPPSLVSREPGGELARAGQMTPASQTDGGGKLESEAPVEIMSRPPSSSLISVGGKGILSV